MDQRQSDHQTLDIASTLDISSIQGVQEHFRCSGGFPILVFREKRQIRTVINPFPGVWRLEAKASVGPRRAVALLIAGPNTFKGKAGEAEPILELAAGDEIVIVPIMSAVRPTGPRIQVPALLADDIGVVEMDVVSGDEGAEGLEDILTLTELGDEASFDDPDGDEVNTVHLSPDSPDESSPSDHDDRKEHPPQSEIPFIEEDADRETTLPDLDLPDELDSALDELFSDEMDSTPDASSQIDDPVQAALQVFSHAGGAA